VISVTEPDVDSNDPTRILIRQVLGALAQYEKTLLKARMAAGRRLKAERGGFTGGIPRFGCSVVRHEYVPLASEQKIVARIRVQRAEGARWSQRRRSPRQARRSLAPRRHAGGAPERQGTWS